jgi:glutamate-1-semialdehyde 2,1-aminomutase
MSQSSTSVGKVNCGGDLGAPAYRTDAADRELFDRKLRNWMPPDAFDAHAHLYDCRHLVPGSTAESFHGDPAARYATYVERNTAWMGDRCPSGALFFPFPVKTCVMQEINRFLYDELQTAPASRGLMMIRPDDDPAVVQAQVRRENWAGFKVYHVYANREHTFHADSEEFLPDWAWELADADGLLIMLHMVLDRAIADERNQRYIREHCIRYPNARLVLAHAARGFCGAHTVEGIHALRGVENVWFDNSAVCEATAVEAILRTFGSTRVLFGTDFPVSEMRGHAMSLGDGFWWLYEKDVDFSQWTLGRPTKVGLQSLLALQQACRTFALRDGEIENIFGRNICQLLADVPRRGPDDARELRDGRGQMLYAEARNLIPGGVQLLSKQPEQFAPQQWPAYFAEAHGCEVVDLDGRRYLDFTHNGVGACLLGYAHPGVTDAVIRRVTLGAMCSLNSPDEVTLAKELIRIHPWAENVRFARGGGEGMAVASRIVRAATGRDVVAFCGYHGWADWYLAANLNADSALDGHLLPGLSPAGVPRGLRGTALPFTYNKLDELKAIVSETGDRLAAVIMEPTRNVDPAPGFLEGVRALCDQTGAKLVFDEVTTGFRLHPGGVHLKYGVTPDVAVFAKALGNGHPIAAVIGNAATMQAAQGSFISSTYWTDGIGPAAALATLSVLKEPWVSQQLKATGEQFRQGLTAVAKESGVPLKLGGLPATNSIGFDHPQSSALVTLLSVRMLARGFLTGGGFYPTLAHEPRQVDAYLSAVQPVFAELASAIERGDIEQRIRGPVKNSGFARLT